MSALPVTEHLVPGVGGALKIEHTFAAHRTGAPLVMLLHGALRYSRDMAPWAAVCGQTYDVASVNLPGHGGSFVPTQARVADFQTEIAALLTRAYAHRTVFVVGESLGGVIALALAADPPGNLAGVVAADPFLSTGKLDLVARSLRDNMRAHPNNSFLPQLAFDVFGVRRDDAAIEDRRYHSYPARTARPALVLTGAQPAAGLPAGIMPPLLDAADRAFLRGVSRLELRELPGVGHTLLTEAPAAAFAAVDGFMRTHQPVQ